MIRRINHLQRKDNKIVIRIKCKKSIGQKCVDILIEPSRYFIISIIVYLILSLHCRLLYHPVPGGRNDVVIRPCPCLPYVYNQSCDHFETATGYEYLLSLPDFSGRIAKRR